MEQIIAAQLASTPKLKTLSRIAYYEDQPGKQIHIDSAFWAPSGESGAKLIPILVIVDVATKFVGFYPEERKNERIDQHFETFKAALKERFPNTSETSLVITDGAKELAAAFRGNELVKHKVSRGMNKAVLAEAAIARLRKRLRSIELELNVLNVAQNSEHRINSVTLPLILPDLTYDLNLKAKQMERPSEPLHPRDEIKLGTSVFLINLHKFFPHALKDVLRKKSYDQPWYFEPFVVTSKTRVNGITKYELGDYIRGETLKFHFYREQLQVIDPQVQAEYVTKWRDYHLTREDTDFF